MKKIKLVPLDPYNEDTLYDIPVVMKRHRVSNALMYIFLVVVTCMPTALILLLLWVMSMDTIDYTFVILFTAFLTTFCILVGIVSRELRSIDQ